MALMSAPSSHLDPVLDAALTYASRGLRVAPIKPGEKYPPMNEWQNVATTDEAIVRSWWTGLYRGHGVGIVTGEQSGTWVLDVDVATKLDKATGELTRKVGDVSLAALEAAHGALPDTVEAITGSGGRHLFFAWDPARPVRNNQNDKVAKDLDLRGDGGQVVAAPTVHPETHQPYRWRPGHAPWEMAIVQAPDWLYDIIKAEARPTKPPQTTPVRPVSSSDDETPIDWFNTNITWSELLERDGWLRLRDVGKEQRYRRPGKTKMENSVSINHWGNDLMWIGTTSMPQLRGGETINKFQYELRTHWNGDVGGLCSHIRRTLMPGGSNEHDDLSWAQVSAFTPSVFDEPAGPADDAAEGDQPEVDGPASWLEPEPLEPELTNGPPFPIEVLPVWMADAAISCAEALQAPVDLPAMLGLGALSAVTMGKIKIRADDEFSDDPWVEDTNLYLVTALPPGAAKSPAFKVMLSCIRDLERELLDQAASAIREAEVTRDILAKKAKAARDAAALPGKTAEDAKEAGRLQAEADMVAIPNTPRLIADDATPEALVKLLATTGERIAVMSSEGSLFDMMAGQYADKGKAASLDVYLKGWSGDGINVDRSSRDAVALAHPLLSVCVTPQPILIKRLGENAEFAGRGVPARFLYSVPASNVGGRDRRARRRRRNTGARARYEEQVKAIGRRTASWMLPATLQFSDEAADAFEDWDQEHEDRLAPGRDLASMSEWMMKLRAYVLRVSALLHIADGADHNEPVSLETIRRAFRLADYWIEHARCVHASWGDALNAVARPARVLVRWAVDEQLDSFTQRDAYMKLRKHDNAVKIGDVVEVLQALIDMGWLRAEGEFPGHRGKTATLLVHPRAADVLHAHDAQPENQVVDNPEVARHESCAYRANFDPSLPSEISDASEPENTAHTRNSHDAQVVEAPTHQSPPPPVANPEAPADPDDDEYGPDWSLV